MQATLPRLAAGACCALMLAGCGGSGAATPTSASPAAASVAKPAATSGSAAASAKPATTSASAQASAKPAAAASAPASSAASAASAKLPGTTKINVSFSQITGNEIPLWMAAETGILQRHGLDASLQLIEGNKGIAAVVSGEVQFADIGGSQVLSAAAGGADLAVIGVIGPVYPFVFIAPASIKTPADLKGKTIGVSTIGDSSDTATRQVLKKAGLDPSKDITIIATGSPQNRSAALIAGAIQGGMVAPPDNLTLEAQGMHEIPELSTTKLPAATQVETVLRPYVTAHRDVVQAYMDSIIEGVAAAKADRTQTVSVLEKSYKSSDDKAMNAAYDFYTGSVLPALPFPKPDQFADAQALLGATNDQVRQYKIDSLLDPSFVQDAANRGLGKA